MASTQIADANGPVRSRDIELGRELGNRPVPTHIARLQRPNAEPELIIATRIDRAGSLSVDEAMDLSRVARLLARNPHPNLTRVRDVVVRDTDMLVVESFLDGQSLGELWRTARSKGTPLPLAVSLRILLDVLSGLEALHSTRLAAGQPAGLVHGEVTPGNVIVGQDGIARLIHTCRVPTAWNSVPDAPRYMAPEILMRERELDGRVDLYSVGALIWEAIAGKAAIEASSAAAVVKYLAKGPLPSPALPRNAPWAATVAMIAMRALSPDRDARYEHAGALRDELLKQARPKIAPPEDVARWVRQLAGTVIQDRRRRFASEAEARLSIDVELSSPGIPLPDRSASSKPVQDAIKTTPAPAMEPAPVVARRPPPPPPAIASRPAGPAPVLAPPSSAAAAAPQSPALPQPEAPGAEPREASPFEARDGQPVSVVPVLAPAIHGHSAGQASFAASAAPMAFSPAMTPSAALTADHATSPDSEPRKRKKRIAWIAAALCVLAGVLLGTWLGLRLINGSDTERTATAPAPSSTATVAPTAEPRAASTIAAEPPATTKPEEPNPEVPTAPTAAAVEGQPAGPAAVAQATPVTPAGGAKSTAEPEPSQAAPAATPEPIQGPPPRPAKRDSEPRNTKGKYQPLGI